MEIKCSCCGSENLRNIAFITEKCYQYKIGNQIQTTTEYPLGFNAIEITKPAAITYDATVRCVEGSVGISLDANTDAKVCMDCGHLELFLSTSLRQKIIKNELEEYEAQKAKTEKTKVLNNKKKDFNCVIDKLKVEIKELSELLKDENKTIKEHKEFESQLNIKESELRKANKELNQIEEDLKKLS